MQPALHDGVWRGMGSRPGIAEFQYFEGRVQGAVVEEDALNRSGWFCVGQESASAEDEVRPLDCWEGSQFMGDVGDALCMLAERSREANGCRPEGLDAFHQMRWLYILSQVDDPQPGALAAQHQRQDERP